MTAFKTTYPGETVIFLDIDGPLIPARMHYHQDNAPFLTQGPEHPWQDHHEIKKNLKFDPVMVSLLNTWVELTDAKIVMSTAWTKYATFEEMMEILENNGIICGDRIHEQWKTTKLKSWSRSDEISNWLFNNMGKIQNYLIIDDDNSVINDHRLNPKKVLLIDFYNGMTFHQIFEGCEILGITDYSKITPVGYKYTY